jgi:hypothetical protein
MSENWLIPMHLINFNNQGSPQYMEKPIVPKGHFLVGQAEYATVIVVKTPEQWFRGENRLYHVFNNYDKAKIFALETVAENPIIECWIKNSQNEYLFFCNKEKTVVINKNSEG